VIASCLHIFCKTCLIRQIGEIGNCPSCRKKLTKDDFLNLPRENRFNQSYESEGYFRSTKIACLIDHLKKMNKDDKAVVFSQFLGMLDLIEYDFKREGISYVVIILDYLENVRKYVAKIAS
jgi:SNF2 family DNA or RNA helicase